MLTGTICDVPMGLWPLNYRIDDSKLKCLSFLGHFDCKSSIFYIEVMNLDNWSENQVWEGSLVPRGYQQYTTCFTFEGIMDTSMLRVNTLLKALTPSRRCIYIYTSTEPTNYRANWKGKRIFRESKSKVLGSTQSNPNKINVSCSC